MNATEALLNKVTRQQTDLIYSTRLYTIFTLLTGEILVYLMMSGFNRRLLTYWLIYMIGVDCYRLFSATHYSWQKKHHCINSDNAKRALIIGTILSGAGWGASALILFPFLDSLHQIILTSILVAVSTGATATLGYIKGIANLFVLLVIVPFIISILIVDKAILILTILVFIYLIFLLKNNTVFYHNSEKLLMLEQKALQHEKELTIQREKAIQANTAKSAFLANMSHELRTPMHAILGFSELGISKFETAPAEKLLGYYSRIHESGQRLLALLNNLLDISKFEAGRMKAEIDVSDICESIDIVTEELAPLFIECAHNVELQVNTENVTAYYDNDKIIRVIRNLLSNAIKFSPHNSRILIRVDDASIAIKGVKQQPADAISVSIIDQGEGVPNDELETVFSTFVQSSKNNSPGGTGLGLSICREIIQLHGGTISATNNPDGGSNFCFVIPRLQPLPNQ